MSPTVALQSGKLMTLGVATLRSTIMSVPWRVLVDILDDGEAFLIVISPKKHLTHNHENVMFGSLCNSEFHVINCPEAKVR